MLKDFEFYGDHVVAKDSGTRIPLTPGLFVDIARGASFVWTIQALKALRAVKGRAPRAKIAFFPQRPRSYYAIWPVCQLADVKIVNDPADADLLFYFEDKAFLTAPPAPPALCKDALNIDCYDVRKSRVERVFEETFGYALAIDPKTYKGEAVQKSEGNGVHDGRIVTCPLDAPDKTLVYQRLIDNTIDGAEYFDIRTPIVGGRIPFVYLKKRWKDRRFSNDNHRVDIATPDDMLTKDEQRNVAKFAAAMGLDFGGLDILRDRKDGRIYIVDVNKTDMGPPTALSIAGKLWAMRRLAGAFAAFVDKRLCPDG
ncbi:MAG: hypothetical protein AAGC95_07705 [Pseudomonadota bacterium]